MPKAKHNQKIQRGRSLPTRKQRQIKEDSKEDGKDEMTKDVKVDLVHQPMNDAEVEASSQDNNDENKDDDDEATDSEPTGSMVSSNKDTTTTTTTTDESRSPPAAKYDVKQKVYARDADGLLYEAIIRRSMFGPHYHKQVQVGFVNSQQEMEEYLARHAEPMWHYFVHYTSWKVNWDRWVSEPDILEFTPENAAWATTILQRHRALQQEFKAKNKHHKVTNANAFLQSWKVQLQALEDERMGGQRKKQMKKSSSKVKPVWTKSCLEKERQLRTLQLESRPNSNHPLANQYQQNLSLPFFFKESLGGRMGNYFEMSNGPCITADRDDS